MQVEDNDASRGFRIGLLIVGLIIIITICLQLTDRIRLSFCDNDLILSTTNLLALSLISVGGTAF